MKNTTIFADHDQKHPEETTPKFLQKDPEVTLSRDEYKEVIKEAYKEGAKDAVRADAQHLTPDQKNGAKEGQRDATRFEAQKREETKQKMEAIKNRNDFEMLRAKTVFPFTLFQDTLIIDTTKVTIIRKQMFATEHITTIPLKDIADATVQTALFLATLIVSYMPHANSPVMIKPVEDHITSLKREDAIKAKNILKGALVAIAEGIDIAKLAPDEVQTVIEKFGTSAGVN